MSESPNRLGQGASPGASLTLQEVRQQPHVWARVAQLVVDRRSEIRLFTEPGQLRQRRVLLTGAGTSAFASEMVVAALRRAGYRRVEAVATTDLVADPTTHLYDEPTLLMSLARSGDSPESLAAVELANRLVPDVRHVVITCNSHGALAHFARQDSRALLLELPPETNDQGFAMTSSATSMILAASLATGLVDPRAVGSLRDAAESVLQRGTGLIDDLVRQRPSHLVFLGSGLFHAVAREAALKATELTAGGVTTTVDSPLGFRHGPKAVMSQHPGVILFEADDEHARRYDHDLLRELACDTTDSQLVAITADENTTRVAGSTIWPVRGLVPSSPVAVSLTYLLYAQMLAVRLGQSRQVAVDNPFPSGEVNRVVRGVVIHQFTSSRTDRSRLSTPPERAGGR